MNVILKNRKLRMLFAFISLLFLIDLVQDSYAKYISSASANNNFTIAAWNFVINQQDVIANNDFSNTIVPVLNTGNSNIKAGVIAPTSTGYFDITIDSSNVDVAFDETISLSLSNDTTVTDVIFTGYQLNNGQLVAFGNNTTPTISSSHSLNEITTTNTYRVFIEWIDGTGETMDNADDTEASADGILTVDVDIQFIQRANS